MHRNVLLACVSQALRNLFAPCHVQPRHAVGSASAALLDSETGISHYPAGTHNTITSPSPSPSPNFKTAFNRGLTFYDSLESGVWGCIVWDVESSAYGFNIMCTAPHLTTTWNALEGLLRRHVLSSSS